MSPILSLAGVTRRYRNGGETTVVLNPLDLTIEAGATLAVWGPSGSGKSTLLRVLGLLDPPDDGSVVFGNQRVVTDEDRRARRASGIGFIFQDFRLVPTLSVVDNVALPLALAGGTLRTHRAEAERVLAGVGLDGFEARHPDDLSGGERQRVAVARAIVRRPVLIVADEPTGNLDRANGRRVLDLVLDVARRAGAAVVVATHDPAVAAACGHRAELCDGNVTISRQEPEGRRSSDSSDSPGVSGVSHVESSPVAPGAKVGPTA